MTYQSDDSSGVGEWMWLNYRYLILEIIDRVMLWTTPASHALTGVIGVTADGENWTYFGGNDDHELDDNGCLTELDSYDTTKYISMSGGGLYNMKFPKAIIGIQVRLNFFLSLIHI